MASKVLTIANHKGGVGKTTLAFHISEALVEQGKKVLAVDMDPQGNLSYTFHNDRIPDEHHVKLLFQGDSFPIPMKIKRNKKGGELYLLGSSIHLASYDLAGAVLTNYFRLKSYLEKELWKHAYDVNFDYVIVDTPPNLGIFTMCSIVAADYIVIPVDLSLYAIDGLRELEKKIEELNNELGYLDRNTKVVGILIMDSEERTNVAKMLSNSLKNEYNELFLGEIPHTIKMKEAVFNGRPIWEIAEDNHRVAMLMKEVINKIISKMED